MGHGLDRVPANLPLYDMLNEFQKGSSHMAAVVKTKSMMRKPSTWGIRDIHKKGLKGNEVTTVDVQTGDLENQQQREKSNHTHLDEGHQYSSNGIREENRNGEDSQVQISPRTAQQSEDIEDLEGGDVIGIITMEDVMEELLQVKPRNLLWMSTFAPCCKSRTENLVRHATCRILCLPM